MYFIYMNRLYYSFIYKTDGMNEEGFLLMFFIFIQKHSKSLLINKK